MTINEYIRILRKRGWIIVLSALLAAIAGYGISALQEEVYRASAHVSTVPARPDWGLGNISKDLMRNFALNIRTPENANEAIARAQLDMDPYTFLGNVDVADDASTFTIEIQARAGEPQVARTMALTFADLFVEERTQYYAQQDKRDRIEVKLRTRDLPVAQIQPKPTVNALAGSVLGLLFGIGVVLFLTWLESDLLRTPSAIERTLELPVLGAIPRVHEPRMPSRPPTPASQVGVTEAA